MTERSLDYKDRNISPEVVREVVGLYRRYVIETLLGTSISIERERLWGEKALLHFEFYDQILGLKESLKLAAGIKGYFPKAQKTQEATSIFLSVQEPLARSLLTDILFARIVSQPLHFYPDVSPRAEGGAMVRELKMDSNLDGEKIKSVTLEQVIEAVLTGDLKLSRQSQKSSLAVRPRSDNIFTVLSHPDVIENVESVPDKDFEGSRVVMGQIMARAWSIVDKAKV